MAKLRGGSTVGGKQIVTLDTMNEFIEQIQHENTVLNMKKSETEETITDFSKTDQFILDKLKNGLWQVSNATNNDSKYNYGNLLNFSHDSARFQIYAPHKEGTSSALYFRTGWANDVRPWERITTKNMLDTELTKKFDKTGGDITGNVSASGYISSNSYLRSMNGNNYVKLSVSGTSSKYETNLTSHDFDKRVNVAGDIYSNSNRVWHDGNLNPSSYVEKNSASLASGTDLDTVKETGFYRCSNPVNRPSKISGWAYIEIVKHSDNYVLQKIYSFDGLHTYSRTLNNGTWTSWRTLGGGLSFTQSITAGSWSLVSDMYEATITHNIGSENITSVIVTDSSKVSMFTGFQVISSTVIKVFCSTNPAGKVVINAIQ